MSVAPWGEFCGCFAYSEHVFYMLNVAIKLLLEDIIK